ncbi:MAG: hypothetical protein WC521_09070 [Bdellovibrionales bacterium]|jgi:hypothetical protein
MEEYRPYFGQIDESLRMPRFDGLRALPEHEQDYYGCIPIPGSNGEKEFLGYNLVSNWTIDRALKLYERWQAEALKREGLPKPVAIGLRPGSGFHDMMLAMCGFNCALIDFDHTAQEDLIDLRNHYLSAQNESSQNKTNGTLGLCEAELRDINADYLVKLCGDAALKVVTAYNVVQRLDDPEIETLFEAVAEAMAMNQIKTGKPVFAVHYVASKSGKAVGGFYRHDPNDIEEKAKKAGLVTAYRKIGTHLGINRFAGFGFCLKPPENRPSV